MFHFIIEPNMFERYITLGWKDLLYRAHSNSYCEFGPS